MQADCQFEIWSVQLLQHPSVTLRPEAETRLVRASGRCAGQPAAIGQSEGSNPAHHLGTHVLLPPIQNEVAPGSASHEVLTADCWDSPPSDAGPSDAERGGML